MVLRKLFHEFTFVLNNDLENRLAKYNIVLADRVALYFKAF